MKTNIDSRPYDWSAAFNALPEPARRIGQAMEIRTRIQQLVFERDRLQERHRQSMGEVAAHIAALEDSLKRIEP